MPPEGSTFPRGGLDGVGHHLVPFVFIFLFFFAFFLDFTDDREFLVQAIPVAVSVSVPEVAVWSPFGVSSSLTSVILEAIVIPV